MRSLAAGLLLLAGLVSPLCARADNQAIAQSFSARASGESGGGALPGLLRSLDLSLIAKAHAAECKQEGEQCKTNADCCADLACSGDPQPTCRPAE